MSRLRLALPALFWLARASRAWRAGRTIPVEIDCNLQLSLWDLLCVTNCSVMQNDTSSCATFSVLTKPSGHRQQTAAPCYENPRASAM